MNGATMTDVLGARIALDGAYMQMVDAKYNGQFVWPAKAMTALAWSRPSVSGNKGTNSARLGVIATFDDGTTEDVTGFCTFTTSDASKATVSGGIVSFEEWGSATITAACTWMDVTLTATMTASTNDYAVSIGLNFNSRTIAVNGAFGLTATATMRSGGTSTDVTWTWSNNTVELSAAAGANVLVRGLSGGNPATVTAHCSDGLQWSEVAASCVVTVSGDRTLDHIAIFGPSGTDEIDSIHINQSAEGAITGAAFRVMAVYGDLSTENVSEYVHINISSGLLQDVVLVTGSALPYVYTYSDRQVSANDGQYIHASYGDFNVTLPVLMN